ncbi:MAG: hypothetical protein L0Y75_07380 [Acidobacteria bacterium]|nr:hypothetical protein [Acidobacteriota bacterium]
MLKDLFELLQQVLRITEDTQQNRQDIKDLKGELRDVARKSEQENRELRGEIRELRSAIERLTYEIKRVDDHGNAEHEKLILLLENQLLKFERGLPSAKPQSLPEPETDKQNEGAENADEK